jgi:hypothetical protein
MSPTQQVRHAKRAWLRTWNKQYSSRMIGCRSGWNVIKTRHYSALADYTRVLGLSPIIVDRFKRREVTR